MVLKWSFLAQREFIVAFECGERAVFFELWNQNVPQVTLERDPTCQDLEFQLSVYFAIYPIKTGVRRSLGVKWLAVELLNNRHTTPPSPLPPPSIPPSLFPSLPPSLPLSLLFLRLVIRRDRCRTSRSILEQEVPYWPKVLTLHHTVLCPTYQTPQPTLHSRNYSR